MISFKKIEKQAAYYHGGLPTLKKKIQQPKSKKDIVATSDDRYLSELSKVIFQIGFKWSLVEEKWDNFESVFYQFNVEKCSNLSDEQLEKIMDTGTIIRNWPKVKSVRDNAIWLLGIAKQHGSVGDYMASIVATEYCSTVMYFKKEGVRVGAKTAQLWLRRLGIDSLVLTEDVLMALKQNNVADKEPSSKKDWSKMQDYLNHWVAEGNYSLNYISQVLAYSVGPKKA